MKILRKSTAIVLLLGIFASNGWHLMALQTYAWFDMFTEFSESYNVTESIEFTLSGKRPCSNCNLVSDLQEKKILDEFYTSWSESKLNLLIPSFDAIQIDTIERRTLLHDFQIILTGRSDVPQTPPPELV